MRNFKKSDIGKYRYCSYWGIWKKILNVKGVWVTERNLTPINRQFGGDEWKECLEETKKTHCTYLNKRDIITDKLPPDIVRLCASKGVRI